MKQTMEQLAKKIDQNKKLKLKQRAKNVKIAKGFILGFVFIILVSLMLKGINAGVNFFRENTIVTNQIVVIKFQKPFEIVSLAELQRRQDEQKVIDDISNQVFQEYLHPTTAQDCTQKGLSIDSGQFFNILRSKESTNGTASSPGALNVYCANKGMWNEIGYSPANKFCFKDQEEAQLYVAYYVKKNCDGKTEAQCECYWNLGTWTDSCYYSQGQLSLAN